MPRAKIFSERVLNEMPTKEDREVAALASGPISMSAVANSNLPGAAQRADSSAAHKRSVRGASSPAGLPPLRILTPTHAVESRRRVRFDELCGVPVFARGAVCLSSVCLQPHISGPSAPGVRASKKWAREGQRRHN